MPVIGYLTSLGQDDRPNLKAAFRRGLSEAGYTEGRNVTIEYRFAENQHDRLPALAADLVERKVSVIAASGGGSAVLAAKAATTAIPIVFTFGGDPVREGIVASLNRPGGNVTGATFFAVEIGGKALGLLHELVPGAALIALMVNPRNPESAHWTSSAQQAARTLGRQRLSSTPAIRPKSRPRLLRCDKAAPEPCWPAATRFSALGVSRLSRWRRVTPSPPYTPTANMSRREG
jgi:putative ABC transport system substrate-binding protein